MKPSKKARDDARKNLEWMKRHKAEGTPEKLPKGWVRGLLKGRSFKPKGKEGN